MIPRRISASIYHGLIMVRHPVAIRLRMKGINYEHYRELAQPWLLDMNIRTILDVGANVGQFAGLAREVFPAAKIFSFEPLPECFAALKSSQPPDKFQAFNVALGEKETELDFYRAYHSPSSSFLPMTRTHKQAFPQSSDGQEAESLKVPVRRLDDITSELTFENNVLLKLDVQGYEDKVLAGAVETLKRVAVIIAETSFVPLYDGQTLFSDIHSLLQAAGFSYHGNLNQMLDPNDQRVVAADSIFVSAAFQKS